MKKKLFKDDLSDIQLTKKGIKDGKAVNLPYKQFVNDDWKDVIVKVKESIGRTGYKYSDIAGEALKTQSEREKDYGPADRNHENIAKIWNVLLFKKLSVELTKEDVALLFCGAKLAREANSHKKDNLVDAVAYLGILDGFNGGKDER